MKHFAAKGATEVDEAGKLIYAALLKVHSSTHAHTRAHTHTHTSLDLSTLTWSQHFSCSMVLIMHCSYWLVSTGG